MDENTFFNVLRGVYLLAPVFGTTINVYKMAPNEEVLYMKIFRIIDMNIFGF